MIDRTKLWKWATAATVVFLFLNPEMIEMALFIDAVGLEMFVLLIQAQAVAFFGVLFNSKLKGRLITFFVSMKTLGYQVITMPTLGSLVLVLLVITELFGSSLLTGDTGIH